LGGEDLRLLGKRVGLPEGKRGIEKQYEHTCKLDVKISPLVIVLILFLNILLTFYTLKRIQDSSNVRFWGPAFFASLLLFSDALSLLFIRSAYPR
jgi:hypothetical protein